MSEKLSQAQGWVCMEVDAITGRLPKKDKIDFLRQVLDSLAANVHANYSADNALFADLQFAGCVFSTWQYSPKESVNENLKKLYTLTGMQPTIVYDRDVFDYDLLLADVESGFFFRCFENCNADTEVQDLIKDLLIQSVIHARNGDMHSSATHEHQRQLQFREAGEHLACAIKVISTYTEQRSQFQNIRELYAALGFSLQRDLTVDPEWRQDVHENFKPLQTLLTATVKEADEQKNSMDQQAACSEYKKTATTIKALTHSALKVLRKLFGYKD